MDTQVLLENDTGIESQLLTQSHRKKSPYSELFWSVFSRIRTEYGPE